MGKQGQHFKSTGESEKGDGEEDGGVLLTSRGCFVEMPRSVLFIWVCGRSMDRMKAHLRPPSMERSHQLADAAQRNYPTLTTTMNGTSRGSETTFS